MKRQSIIILMIALLLVALGVLVHASAGVAAVPGETLELRYDFAPPTVTLGDDGHRVRLGELPVLGQAGQPDLPYQVARVLLPPGRDVSAVTVRAVGEALWPAPVRPALARAQRPLGAPWLSIAAALLERVAGQCSDGDAGAGLYPARRHQVLSVQHLGGYRVLLLRLFPVRYDPAQAQLTYVQELQVSVHLKPLAQGAMRPAGQDVAARVGQVVDNPALMGAYQALPIPERERRAATLVTPDQPYDYVIVTSAALSPTFRALVDWRIDQGLRARVFTTEEIYAVYDGQRPDGDADDATRLRNFLIDAYGTWGGTAHPLRYVLLGGDIEVVPARYVSVAAGIYRSDRLISDHYYAGLDGTWDDDADGRYGEGDAAGGGTGMAGEEADLYAELYVGRVPASDAVQAGRFISKVIAYESAPEADLLDEALMLGERLDNKTYAGDYVDELIALAPPLDVTRMYDRDEVWRASDLIPRLNAGVHMVHHLGHAYHAMLMRMNRTQVDSLTNPFPFLVHTQGCLPAQFDQDDAIGEHFVLAAHGAFAFIGNTQYGWYLPGSTDGASQLFHRAFMKASFGPDEGPASPAGGRPLGWVLQTAKEGGLYRVGVAGPERWVYLELVLLGDPATGIVTDYAAPVARITAPAGGGAVAGDVPLIGSAHAGTAAGATLARYRLDYGSGVAPTAWMQIGVTATLPVTAGPLGTWDTGLLPDGPYALRLTSGDGAGRSSTDQFALAVDHAAIKAPAPGAFLRGGTVISVTGTASRGDLQRYALHFGAGAAPTRWTPIYSATAPVVAGALASWDSGVITQAGRYALRLQVQGDAYTGTDTLPLVVDPLYQVGWPQTVAQRLSESALAVGDLDGDGDLEVVAAEGMRVCGGALSVLDTGPASVGGRCGSYGMHIYAWHHDGQPVAGWPQMPGSDNRLTTPALADLSAGGNLEVIVGSIDGRVYVYDHQGAPVAGWPQATGDALYATPAVADLHGDGALQVVACSYDGQTYAWRHDGTLVAGWPQFTGRCDASPLLVDVDADGDREVVVTGREGRLSAFHADGSLVSGWPLTVTGRFVASPAAADLDGDGVQEIVAAAQDALYVWQPDGTPVSGWPKLGLAGDLISSPALADLDGDGDLEIVLAGTALMVYAWHHDGTMVDGWGLAKAPVAHSSPVVGDIDGDGDLEVLLAGDDYDEGLYAWHHDGTPVAGWPRLIPTRDVPTPSWDRRCSAVLADLDGDGDVEAGLGVEAQVFFWDTAGRPDRMVWSTFQADVARTGVLGALASLWPVTLTGQVRDGLALTPVHSATVRADPGPSAVTGAEGRYTMTLSAGVYSVTGMAWGYVPYTVRGLQVTSGTVRLDLALQPSRRLYLPLTLRAVPE